MQARLGLLLLAAVIAGCGTSTTLDASSDAALDASIKKMTAELNQQDQQLFTVSLMAITLRQQEQSAAAGQFGRPTNASEMMKSLHGLTAQQIIARGKQASEAHQSEKAARH